MLAPKMAAPIGGPDAQGSIPIETKGGISPRTGEPSLEKEQRISLQVLGLLALTLHNIMYDDDDDD
jgi:hypothetical protein